MNICFAAVFSFRLHSHLYRLTFPLVLVITAHHWIKTTQVLPIDTEYVHPTAAVIFYQCIIKCIQSEKQGNRPRTAHSSRTLCSMALLARTLSAVAALRPTLAAALRPAVSKRRNFSLGHRPLLQKDEYVSS